MEQTVNSLPLDKVSPDNEEALIGSLCGSCLIQKVEIMGETPNLTATTGKAFRATYEIKISGDLRTLWYSNSNPQACLIVQLEQSTVKRSWNCEVDHDHSLEDLKAGLNTCYEKFSNKFKESVKENNRVIAMHNEVVESRARMAIRNQRAALEEILRIFPNTKV